MNTYKIYSTNNPDDTTKLIEAKSNQEALDKYCYSYGLVDYADFLKSRKLTGAKAELIIQKINVKFCTFEKTPYGISSFSYPNILVVDGMTYSVSQTQNTDKRTLIIEDANGKLFDCLTLSESGEYWHTELNTIHVNEFNTIQDALIWAIATAE